MMKKECDGECLKCELKACIWDDKPEKVNSIVGGNIEGFNERLRNALVMRDMRQSKLASLTGISQPTISGYVNGLRSPRGEHIFIICKALKISADWLLGLEVEE